MMNKEIKRLYILILTHNLKVVGQTPNYIWLSHSICVELSYPQIRIIK